MFLSAFCTPECVECTLLQSFPETMYMWQMDNLRKDTRERLRFHRKALSWAATRTALSTPVSLSSAFPISIQSPCALEADVVEQSSRVSLLWLLQVH